MAGCGGGDTTTVIKEQPTVTVEETVEVPAEEPEPVEKEESKPKPAPSPEPEPEPSQPPNTVGLTLTLAEELMEEAGYRVDAENTDTTFGIFDTDNYTICSQDPPRGAIVHVLAQKYGC